MSHSTACYIIAKTWATMEGDLDAFLAEEPIGKNFDPNDAGFTGHFLGYMAEAADLLEEIELAGFQIVKVTA